MSYRADKKVLTAHTDGHTDRQTQATTIPKGQNWPRVNIQQVPHTACFILSPSGFGTYSTVIYVMEHSGARKPIFPMVIAR